MENAEKLTNSLKLADKHRNYDLRTFEDDDLNPKIKHPLCGHTFRTFLFDKADVETEDEFGGCPKCWQKSRDAMWKEIYGGEEVADREMKYGCPEKKFGIKTINYDR